MITVSCDICGVTIKDRPIRVEFKDGEHPHSRSTMTRTTDLCVGCVLTITDLHSYHEWDSIDHV